jgi:hypothetical protein
LSFLNSAITKAIKLDLLFRIILSWAWWCTSVTPALKRLRQKDLEFRVSLDCMARLSQKQNKAKKIILFWITHL